MKVFLLSAGYGTRLKPLTDKTPKCLIEVCGKPMLYWWGKLFEKYGIDAVLINTHHLPIPVWNYLASDDSNIYWDVAHEKELLGSGGTLRKNKSFVRGYKDFIVCYSDVLTDINLDDMVAFHRANNSPFTMAVAEADDPKSKGVVEIKDSLIVSFDEKPKHPKSNLCNMGVYVCNQEVLDLIPDGYSDIGVDILPKLTGKIFAYYNKNTYFCDMGTHEGLKLANETWNQ